MDSSRAFDLLVEQLGKQHKAFLEQTTASVVEALKLENVRLVRENEQLLLKLGPNRAYPSRRTASTPAISDVSTVQLVEIAKSTPSLPQIWPKPPPVPKRPWTADSRQSRRSPSFADRPSTAGVVQAPPLLPGAAIFHDDTEDEQHAYSAPFRGLDEPPPKQPEVPEGRAMTNAGTKKRHFANTKQSSFCAPVGASVTGLGRDRVVKNREIRRIRQLLKLGRLDTTVGIANFESALWKRDDAGCKGLDRPRLIAVMEVLENIVVQKNGGPPTGTSQQHGSRTNSTPATIEIEFYDLFDILNLPELHPFLDISSPEYEDICALIHALTTPTMDEIIDKAIMGGVGDAAITARDHKDMGSETAVKPTLCSRYRGKGAELLNMLVSAAVILSMVGMGVSIDREPEHIRWFVLDILCIMVFITEVIYKIGTLGCKGYFFGAQGPWNFVDFTVTATAFIEILFSIMTMTDVEVGSGATMATAFKVIVFLRALRLVRIVRLVDMVDSPAMRDLANMLVGFVIGIPSLFWVMFFLGAIIAMFGLFCRLAFGPLPGQALLVNCGLADDHADRFDDPDCPMRLVLGEEYFATVGVSMFTVFRFMLGDFSSRRGMSIVVAFSQDYGWKFDLGFTLWMMSVIFGVFNIIASVFVDTTVAGLKNNDVKRRYARHYAQDYVRKKLQEMLIRIHIIMEDCVCGDPDERTTPGKSAQEMTEKNFVLSETQFVQIITDHTVQELLSDMDIDLYHAGGMFLTFDSDDSGTVTIQELIEGILQLRGEPQKADIVGCWNSTRLLHEKLSQMFAVKEGMGSDGEAKAGHHRRVPSKTKDEQQTAVITDARELFGLDNASSPGSTSSN